MTAKKVVSLLFLVSPSVLLNSSQLCSMLTIHILQKKIENVGPIRREVAVPGYIIGDIGSQ